MINNFKNNFNFNKSNLKNNSSINYNIFFEFFFNNFFGILNKFFSIFYIFLKNLFIFIFYFKNEFFNFSKFSSFFNNFIKIIKAFILSENTIFNNLFIFTFFSLIFFEFFNEDPEILLFFSCTFCVFFIGSYISKILDNMLESYSNSILDTAIESFILQLDNYTIESDMNRRFKILDNFILYSLVFIEKNLIDHFNSQINIFSYKYTKIIESNFISEAERFFCQDHFNSLIFVIQLEKFVFSYIILDLISTEFELSE